MAGGIYVDKPFSPNIKCILFATMMIAICESCGVYGFNHYLIPLIFISSYILMAVYDYNYNCDDYLKSGTVMSVDSIFKPQRRDGTDNKIQEAQYMKYVSMFHIIIMPLLIYIGYMGAMSNTKMFGVLAGLGGMGMLYHTGRFFVPRTKMC
jgi:hypothetical protein